MRVTPTTILVTAHTSTSDTPANKPTVSATTATFPAPPTSDVGFAGTFVGSCAPIYKQSYRGPASNFPRMSEWKSFDELVSYRIYTAVLFVL